MSELQFDIIHTFPWAHNLEQPPQMRTLLKISKQQNLLLTKSELLPTCLHSWLMAQPQQLKTDNGKSYMKIASDIKNVSWERRLCL